MTHLPPGNHVVGGHTRPGPAGWGSGPHRGIDPPGDLPGPQAKCLLAQARQTNQAGPGRSTEAPSGQGLSQHMCRRVQFRSSLGREYTARTPGPGGAAYIPSTSPRPAGAQVPPVQACGRRRAHQSLLDQTDREQGSAHTEPDTHHPGKHPTGPHTVHLSHLRGATPVHHARLWSQEQRRHLWILPSMGHSGGDQVCTNSRRLAWGWADNSNTGEKKEKILTCSHSKLGSSVFFPPTFPLSRTQVFISRETAKPLGSTHRSGRMPHLAPLTLPFRIVSLGLLYWAFHSYLQEAGAKPLRCLDTRIYRPSLQTCLGGRVSESHSPGCARPSHVISPPPAPTMGYTHAFILGHGTRLTTCWTASAATHPWCHAPLLARTPLNCTAGRGSGVRIGITC